MSCRRSRRLRPTWNSSIRQSVSAPCPHPERGVPTCHAPRLDPPPSAPPRPGEPAGRYPYNDQWRDRGLSRPWDGHDQRPTSEDRTRRRHGRRPRGERVPCGCESDRSSGRRLRVDRGGRGGRGGRGAIVEPDRRTGARGGTALNAPLLARQRLSPAVERRLGRGARSRR